MQWGSQKWVSHQWGGQQWCSQQWGSQQWHGSGRTHASTLQLQCCGSGSGRIRTFFPDLEISPPNPDPDPALVVLKKISVSVQYRAYVYLCPPQM